MFEPAGTGHWFNRIDDYINDLMRLSVATGGSLIRSRRASAGNSRVHSATIDSVPIAPSTTG